MAPRKDAPAGGSPKSAADVIDAAHVVRDRAAAAKLARGKAERDALVRELELAEARLGVIAELDEHRKPLAKPLVSSIAGFGVGSKRRGVAVAVGSDWHVEERVDPRTIDGLNDYNPAIARRRAVRFFEGIEWLSRDPRFDVQSLVLVGLGDIITGYIHEELLEGNYMSPTEACLFAQDLWSDGIRFLLAKSKLERLVVPWLFGNHGRTTIKPRVATAAKNSYEWLLGHMLAKEFRDEPRVQFMVADGHHMVVPIGPYRLHLTHGDKVKSMGGIGGVDVPLNRAVAQWHRTMPAECTAVGHFHEYNSGQRLARNGSLIGYSPFSRDIVRAPYEPPQQTFFLVDSVRGKTQCAPIWVDEAPTGAPARTGRRRS